MLNQDIAITRSTGDFSDTFDFTGATPPLDIAAGDEILFRVEDKAAPLIVKRNDNADGSSAEVDYNPSTDVVTVKMTEDEKNSMPDSGYTFKIFVNGEVEAYGDITASGTSPDQGPDPTPAQYVNGNNVTSKSADFDVELTDDYIIVTTASGTPVDAKMIDATQTGLSGKRYWFLHTGDGTLNINDKDDVLIKALTVNGWYLAVTDEANWKL